MTNKQRRFVEEYLIDLNATQAAIRAGYSPDTAEEQGARLLRFVKVSTAVKQAIAERSRRTGVNAERVVTELAKIAFANITDIANITEAVLKDDAARDDTAAVLSVKVKRGIGESVEREIKMHDKVKALEQLGRHLGLFNDKLRLENLLPVVIHGEADLS